MILQFFVVGHDVIVRLIVPFKKRQRVPIADALHNNWKSDQYLKDFFHG